MWTLPAAPLLLATAATCWAWRVRVLHRRLLKYWTLWSPWRTHLMGTRWGTSRASLRAPREAVIPAPPVQGPPSGAPAAPHRPACSILAPSSSRRDLNSRYRRNAETPAAILRTSIHRAATKWRGERRWVVRIMTMMISSRQVSG